MDRFDEEAGAVVDSCVVLTGNPHYNAKHIEEKMAAWGRKLYAEGLAAGLAEGEAKLHASQKDCGPQSCKHNLYWRTMYGNCMACRVEEAEAKLAMRDCPDCGFELRDNAADFKKCEEVERELRAKLAVLTQKDITNNDLLRQAESRIGYLEGENRKLFAETAALLGKTGKADTAYKVLRQYQGQCDEDGTNVIVSREALDEILNGFAAMTAEAGRMRAKAREIIEWCAETDCDATHGVPRNASKEICAKAIQWVLDDKALSPEPEKPAPDDIS